MHRHFYHMNDDRLVTLLSHPVKTMFTFQPGISNVDYHDLQTTYLTKCVPWMQHSTGGNCISRTLGNKRFIKKIILRAHSVLQSQETVLLCCRNCPEWSHCWDPCRKSFWGRPGDHLLMFGSDHGQWHSESRILARFQNFCFDAVINSGAKNPWLVFASFMICQFISLLLCFVYLFLGYDGNWVWRYVCIHMSNECPIKYMWNKYWCLLFILHLTGKWEQWL